jgi:hypothetical protein
MSMFRFTAQGRIGRIDQVKGASEVVRVSVAADRLVEGKDGAFTKTEWLSLISFDQPQNERMLIELEVGQAIKVDGRVEPRKRELNGQTIYDHSFVITRFERLSAPKAKKAKPAEQTDAADA